MHHVIRAYCLASLIQCVLTIFSDLQAFCSEQNQTFTVHLKTSTASSWFISRYFEHSFFSSGIPLTNWTWIKNEDIFSYLSVWFFFVVGAEFLPFFPFRWEFFPFGRWVVPVYLIAHFAGWWRGSGRSENTNQKQLPKTEWSSSMGFFPLNLFSQSAGLSVVVWGFSLSLSRQVSDDDDDVGIWFGMEPEAAAWLHFDRSSLPLPTMSVCGGRGWKKIPFPSLSFVSTRSNSQHAADFGTHRSRQTDKQTDGPRTDFRATKKTLFRATRKLPFTLSAKLILIQNQQLENFAVSLLSFRNYYNEHV